jgi:cell division protein FtsQ
MARLKQAGVIALVLVAVVAAVWGIDSILEAYVYAVNSVEVTGVMRLTEQQVIDLAGIPRDATLLNIGTGEIAHRIEADPWVDSVELDRDFPSTLKIAVTERVPVAMVDAGGTDLWLVAADATWLGPRTADDTGVVTIRDIADLEPAAGVKATSKELVNAIAVARGIGEELRSATRAISAPSIEKTAIITNEDVEVFIGDAENIASKARIATEILEREKGKVVYINVRVVDRPTWRGLE